MVSWGVRPVSPSSPRFPVLVPSPWQTAYVPPSLHRDCVSPPPHICTGTGPHGADTACRRSFCDNMYCNNTTCSAKMQLYNSTTCNVRRRTCSATCNSMQHEAYNMQHATIQHAVRLATMQQCNNATMQHAVRHATMQHEACNNATMQHAVRHATIQHEAGNMQHAVRRSDDASFRSSVHHIIIRRCTTWTRRATRRSATRRATSPRSPPPT
jgi:hypothetical protein